MRKRFTGRARGSRGVRPSRTWVSLDTAMRTGSLSSTTATSLLSLQAPTTLTLTSDPPEDMTVLRIVGDYAIKMSGSGAEWVMALTVQDTAWTPSASFVDDADKRILWSRTYSTGTGTAVSVELGPNGTVEQDSGGSPTRAYTLHPDITRIDIAPKVRIECGKALFLVCYEQAGTGTFEVDTTQNVRLLFQRSFRR